MFVSPPDTSNIAYADGPHSDAFGRLRVGAPFTQVDLKQNVTSLPLFFDDQEVSGSGTSSTYSSNRASSIIGVSATTAGKRVRQTKIRGNYQTGKSLLALATFANISSGTGITKRVGYFTDGNGIFLQHSGGVAAVVVRSSVTGSPVDTAIAQSAWNVDKLDGTGKSGVVIDFTKAQILVIDFEWLGAGRVRVGFDIGGTTYYCHYFNFANSSDSVYMSSPNQPIRYEITNDGTGAADTFEAICATVMSEGGIDSTAITTYVSRNGTSQTLANQDLYTPIVSIRLKSNRL